MQVSPRNQGAAMSPRERAWSNASSVSSSAMSRATAAATGAPTRRMGAREDAHLRTRAVLQTQRVLVAALDASHQALTHTLDQVNEQLVRQNRVKRQTASSSVEQQQKFMAEVRVRAAKQQRRLEATFRPGVREQTQRATAHSLRATLGSDFPTTGGSVKAMIQRHVASTMRTRACVEVAHACKHAAAFGGDDRAHMLAAEARALHAERKREAEAQAAAARRWQREQRRVSVMARRHSVLLSGDKPLMTWSTAAAAAVLVTLGGSH